MKRVVALLVMVAAIVPASGMPGQAASMPHGLISEFAGLKVVIAARPNAGSNQMIYTVDWSSGFDRITQITDSDGYSYDWPTWAFGGTKLIYTAVEAAAPEKGENLWVMDPDGSNRVQLTFGTWRSVQPKVRPDGTSVVFNAQWHEFPLVALFEYSFITGEVRNLSSPSQEDGARDSDPKWVPDGARIVFANTRGADRNPEQPTQIYTMRPDGSDRVRLTKDNWWNTDPSLSPDGRFLATSSYRGPGNPKSDTSGEFDVKFSDWHLAVLDTVTGGERVYTGGEDCTLRSVWAPCSPTDGPAWVPQWSPDGSMIGYISVRSWAQHGLYVIDENGRNARPLVERSDLAMTWWDWTSVSSEATYRPFVAPKRIPADSLLLGARPGKDKPLGLITASADRWIDASLAVAKAGVDPEFARWTPDKKKIVFTARHSVDRSKRPPIQQVTGVTRNEHYTLNDYTFVELPPSEEDSAETQVYLMNADGTGVRQLTTPWTEDWLEAMPDADARGNTDPDVSPDGRFVLFTNISTTIPESYILRLDLQTGEVLNLSAISAGAMAVADSKARWSPDGKRIAFSSIIGNVRQLFVMDADGHNATQITNDDYNNFDAAWSPDGNEIAFESYRGTLLFSDEEATPTRALDLKNWFLAKVDLRTSVEQTLTRAVDSPVFRPVWSPDGSRIAYISAGLAKLQIDVAMMNADGSDAHLLNTLRTKEEFVDWR